MVEELNGVKEGEELIVLKFCKILIRESRLTTSRRGRRKINGGSYLLNKRCLV